MNAVKVTESLILATYTQVKVVVSTEQSGVKSINESSITCQKLTDYFVSNAFFS